MDRQGMSKWFEVARRAEGQHKDEEDATFVRVKDGAPAWVLDAVREAHQGMLPNDWVFEECRAAAEAIDECDEGALDGDWITEHADARVEVYTKQLFQWATDFCLTEIFAEAEERANDLGDAGEKIEISKRLSMIQFYAIDRIAQTMLDAYKDARDEGEDETEEAEEASP